MEFDYFTFDSGHPTGECATRSDDACGVSAAARRGARLDAMMRAFARVFVLMSVWIGQGPAHAAAFSIAFHYGDTLPLDALRAHDVVVVEADHGHAPDALGADTAQFAYVSIGEVHPGRSYAAQLPAQLKRQDNPDWGSAVIDVSRREWAQWVADNVVAPLWARGYRGLFLDTLDSYRLLEDVDPAAAQQGLVRLIETLAARFPGIRLILNRGFELLPEVHRHVVAVAAESLHRGWNARTSRYVNVSEADRAWLRARVDEVRQRYGLPVLAIDYLPAAALDEARALARRMLADGIIPWIAEPSLTTLGTGAMEALPRRVLVVYDAAEAKAVHYTNAHRYVEMPLNYHGYIAEYALAGPALPRRLDPRIYAGIVTWINGRSAQGKALSAWMSAQIAAGMKVAVLDDFGFPLGDTTAGRLGLSVESPAIAPVTLTASDPIVGFEIAAHPRSALLPISVSAPEGTPLAEVTDAQGRRYHPAAIMPWGGYLIAPFGLTGLAGIHGVNRWVSNPFDFLKRALRLPPRPVPDPSTASGRRLLMAHIDGDGFASRGEFPGSPLAAQVLLDKVLRRYRIPHAMSVIEGEVSAQGLYPALSPRLEAIARKMFALPHVEIASHSYSHPFHWRKVFDENQYAAEGSYNLAIPGYTPDAEREIIGSADYIRKRLAPDGKPVRLMLWTGNAIPDAAALAIAADHGLLDMNGGSTTMSRRRPTVSAVSAIGVHQGPYYQIYAPVLNENVFTNNWTGPFYGFREVIDTFRMTGAPRRLKPVNIYYHTYSAGKTASLRALHEVYAWALEQPLHPVFPTEYIAMARNFDTLTFARALDDPEAFHVRHAQVLRNLRLPPELPAVARDASSGLAGFADGPDGAFATLSASRATLRFARTAKPAERAAPDTSPMFVSANARLDVWQGEGRRQRIGLRGHVTLRFALSHPARCQLSAEGHRLDAVRREGAIHHYQLGTTDGDFILHCPA